MIVPYCFNICVLQLDDAGGHLSSVDVTSTREASLGSVVTARLESVVAADGMRGVIC